MDNILAYELCFDNIIDGFDIFFMNNRSDFIVFDNNRKGFEKRVRCKLNNIINEFELKDILGNTILEEDIKFRRCPDYDKRMLNGTFVSRQRFNRNVNKHIHNKRLIKILKDNTITHCHIYKNGYYYSENYCGYTEKYEMAGVYPKNDAVSHCMNCLELSCKPIINTSEHNDKIMNLIKQLETHII